MPIGMRNAGAGRPVVRDGDRRRRPPWATLLALLYIAAAATALYHVYKPTAVRRLQICELGQLVYSPLNRTMAELELNITLCWK